MPEIRVMVPETMEMALDSLIRAGFAGSWRPGIAFVDVPQRGGNLGAARRARIEKSYSLSNDEAAHGFAQNISVQEALL